MCPGLGISLAEEITSGNWSRVDFEGGPGGCEVPPFTPTEALEFAQNQLESLLVKHQAQRLVRKGPWYVRVGLVKPSGVLDKVSLGHRREMIAAAEATSEKIERSSWVPAGMLGETPETSQPSGCCAR